MRQDSMTETAAKGPEIWKRMFHLESLTEKTNHRIIQKKRLRKVQVRLCRTTCQVDGLLIQMPQATWQTTRNSSQTMISAQRRISSIQNHYTGLLRQLHPPVAQTSWTQASTIHKRAWKLRLNEGHEDYVILNIYGVYGLNKGKSYMCHALKAVKASLYIPYRLCIVIFVGLWELLNLEEKKYLMILISNYSRCPVTYLLKQENEMLGELQEFVTTTSNKFQRESQTFCTMQGVCK